MMTMGNPDRNWGVDLYLLLPRLLNWGVAIITIVAFGALIVPGFWYGKAPPAALSFFCMAGSATMVLQGAYLLFFPHHAVEEAEAKQLKQIPFRYQYVHRQLRGGRFASVRIIARQVWGMALLLMSGTIATYILV